MCVQRTLSIFKFVCQIYRVIPNTKSMMEQGLNSDSARIFPVQLLRQELLKHQQKEDKKSAKKQNKDGVTSTSVPSVLRGTSLDQHLDGMFKNCAADKNDDDDDDVAIPGWKI